MVEEKQKTSQAESEQRETYLRRRIEVAAVAEHRTNNLRRNLSKLRRDTTENLQGFQRELESSKDQLSRFTQEAIIDTSKVAENVKHEAFYMWLQRVPDTDTQISAQDLLNRVTAKL
jgi:hypothetical protein